MAISKEKVRIQISLTHKSAEKLQLLALANSSEGMTITKSDIIEHLLAALPDPERMGLNNG